MSDHPDRPSPSAIGREGAGPGPATDTSASGDVLFPEIPLDANAQIVVLGLIGAGLYLFGDTVWDVVSGMI